MRLSRDHLVFRAFVVLDEAVGTCRAAPFMPSLGQRFALMFLYALSDGDRRAYDDFWRIVRDPDVRAPNQFIADGMRETNARTCLTRIARSVGVDLSVEYRREMSIARMAPDQRRELREADARLAEHRRRLSEDGWQYEAEDRARAATPAAIEAVPTEQRS